ncbi:MAG: hypothetical protein DI635_00705 [Pseudoxanthomonas suwonensis]|nr:MAG: hypothetical protein DI635_00705 [Pseudoxanthomonas suwonensis]
MTETAAAERTATLAEFAKLSGYKLRYITEAKLEGRLVLDADGRVLVSASLQRMRDTLDGVPRDQRPPLPETASQSEFAAIYGCRRSYVTELRQAGRLVMAADGRRVQVRESLQRLRDTADPSRTSTVQRHAEARAAATAQQDAPQASPAGRPAPALPATASQSAAGDAQHGADAADNADDDLPQAGSYQAARAVKEKYLALQAKLAYQQAVGKLLATADVEAAAGRLAGTLVSRLDALPAQLAPQLLSAAGDEVALRRTLVQAFDDLRAELARQFAALARPEADRG